MKSSIDIQEHTFYNGGKSSLGDWLWRYCMEKDELKQEIIEMVEKIKRTDALLYLYAYI